MLFKNSSRWIVAVGAIVGVATSSFAQTQPSSAAAPPVQARPSQGPVIDPVLHPPYVHPGALYPRYGYDRYPEFPSLEAGRVAAARAQAAAARMQYLNARSDMNLAVVNAQRDFESSTELRDALRELNSTRERYEAARARVIVDVENQQDYQDAVSGQAAVGRMILELRRREEVKPSELVPLANQKMQYASRATEIMSRALNSDQEVQQAQADLVRAGDRVANLREQFARSIRQNPDWQAARAAMQDARMAKAASSGFLEGALEAREDSLDYIYDRLRQPVPSYPPYLMGPGIKVIDD